MAERSDVPIFGNTGAGLQQRGMRGGVPVENPTCTCKCNPGRLDKRPPKSGCNHITPTVEKTNCDACIKKTLQSSGGKHASHHLGCPCSQYYNKTHAKIAELRGDKKISARDGTKKDARPRPSDAKGLTSVASFSGFKPKTAPPKASPPPAPPTPAPAEAPPLAERLWSAACAVGAVFYPPTPQKRDAETAIGDGTVGDDADRTRPMPALAEDLEAIAADENVKLGLPNRLEAQIDFYIRPVPESAGSPRRASRRGP